MTSGRTQAAVDGLFPARSACTCRPPCLPFPPLPLRVHVSGPILLYVQTPAAPRLARGVYH